MFSVGGNTDGTDSAETHRFFNSVENLRIITDLWPLRDHLDYAENTNNSLNSMINIIKSSNYTNLWPLRDHRRFSAIIGVTWSDADDNRLKSRKFYSVRLRASL